MSKLKVGDVVQLKSENQRMTIESIEGNNAVCVWTIKSKKKKEKFTLETLKLWVSQARVFQLRHKN